MPLEPAARRPLVLFGAFDRHNLGDLLFPHVLARMLPGRPLLFAGLAARDLRAEGGHRVDALHRVANALPPGEPVDLLHVGGELLTCDAWEAAVMLAAPDALPQTLDAQPDWLRDGPGWARERFGFASLAPYAATRRAFAQPLRTFYNAVGGVDLPVRDPALRAQVSDDLRAAAFVSVRDRRTQAALQAHGIAARLVPDPAVMVAALFGDRIRARAAGAELARSVRDVRHVRDVRDVRDVRKGRKVHGVHDMHRPYIAVQFSAAFGDDRTLAAIAAQLDRIALQDGLGVIFFGAGAAPWHDDPACYERVAARMRARPVALCTSRNVWDLCALIAGSRVYCGSSLHGRIVATAFARPAVTLRDPAAPSYPTKHDAYAATWEGAPTAAPASVDIEHLADGIRATLGANPARRQQLAVALAARYRDAFAAIREKL